ncbi:hypothetical protein D3C71_1604930 [compost metagenome]
MGDARLNGGQRVGGGVVQRAAGLQLSTQQAEERGDGWGFLVAQQIGVEQRAVEGHEAGVTADGQVQGGDVAVAYEWFGVAF